RSLRISALAFSKSFSNSFSLICCLEILMISFSRSMSDILLRRIFLSNESSIFSTFLNCFSIFFSIFSAFFTAFSYFLAAFSLFFFCYLFVLFFFFFLFLFFFSLYFFFFGFSLCYSVFLFCLCRCYLHIFAFLVISFLVLVPL